MSDVQRFPSEKLRSVCSSSTCRCHIYIPPNSLACKCSSIDVDSCRLCKYFEHLNRVFVQKSIKYLKKNVFLEFLFWCVKTVKRLCAITSAFPCCGFSRSCSKYMYVHLCIVIPRLFDFKLHNTLFGQFEFKTALKLMFWSFSLRLTGVLRK